MTRDLLETLNPEQREAVIYTGGPMLVVAGAGSGKTRVITCKVAYLIGEGLFQPDEILAVTFTNKAAREMQERVQAFLGPRMARMPLVCTFHSFCARFLRREIGVLGYPSQFTIYDADDQKSLVKRLLKDMSAGDEVTPDAVIHRISQAKIRHVTPSKYAEQFDRDGDEIVAKAYRRYEEQMREAGALDFDDLILKTNDILEGHPDVRERVNRRYRYLLVDEFQDTNPPQFLLVRHLTAGHKNICVVGDEDQSIYGFRGAILANILHFEKDFPGSRIFKLEENYRCSRNILRAGSSLIANNLNRRDKTLRTANAAGSPVGLFEAENPALEASSVSRAVKRILVDSDRGTVGVLYRTNFQSRRLEDAFRGQTIRYRVVGGLSFYSRKEIKDLAAYLKLLANRSDTVSFLRIINTPPRGIGEKTVEQLRTAASRSGRGLWDTLNAELDGGTVTGRARTTLAQFRELLAGLEKAQGELKLGEYVESVLARSGYEAFLQGSDDPTDESRLENVRELVTMAAEHEKEGGTIGTFLDRLSLFTDSEEGSDNGRVVLMTLHGAKGLEFDHVFIVGLEEGLVPHFRAMDNPDDIEEERRLLYVGMTRARRHLTLSRCQARPKSFDKEPERVNPSRFLREIAPDCLVRLDPFTLTPRAGAAAPPSRQPRLDLDGAAIRTFNTVEDIRNFFGGPAAREGGGGEGGGPPKPAGPRIVSRASQVLPPVRLPDSKADRGVRPPTPARVPATGAPTPPGTAPKIGERRPLAGFKAGERVRHEKFGNGCILRVETSSIGRKLTISFENRGIKVLLEHLADLQKI
ncbi:MAG: UvrD-helicase domain-containing protein [Acidobacteria bacterium]|nr:UvrD-helicase domain-containing protein [Acidobacteriota bacterium]